jgi:hypothetical protein
MMLNSHTLKMCNLISFITATEFPSNTSHSYSVNLVLAFEIINEIIEITTH